MIDDDNKTLWCGNLSDQVSEELLYELFLQGGPLEKVKIPRDKDGRQKNFAFITYSHEVSVPYALNLFRGTALYHKTLSLQCRSRNAMLPPPPIRCTSFDQSYDFLSQTNIKQQFETMTSNLNSSDQRSIQSARQNNELHDQLIMASLQGNWTRHHPYRNDRDDRRHHGRGRDNNMRGREDHIRGRDDHMRGRDDHVRGRDDYIRGRDDQIRGRDDQNRGRDDQISRNNVDRTRPENNWHGKRRRPQKNSRQNNHHRRE